MLQLSSSMLHCNGSTENLVISNSSLKASSPSSSPYPASSSSTFSSNLTLKFNSFTGKSKSRLTAPIFIAKSRPEKAYSSV